MIKILSLRKQIGRTSVSGIEAFQKGNTVKLWDPKKKEIIKTIVTEKSLFAKTKRVYNQFGACTDMFLQHKYEVGGHHVLVNVHIKANGNVIKNTLEANYYNVDIKQDGLKIVTDKLLTRGGPNEHETKFIPKARFPRAIDGFNLTNYWSARLS